MKVSFHMICFLFLRVHAALKLTLPNRQDLINKLLTKRTPDEINVFSDEIIQSCNIIERTTPELFRKNGLTKLP